MMYKERNLTPEKRQRILNAAGALFAARGYEDTSFKEIATTSNIVIGSIGHFFGSKSDLAAAVHQDVVEHLAVVLEHALEDQDYDLRRAIQSVISVYFEWGHANPIHLHNLTVLADYGSKQSKGSANAFQGRMERILEQWYNPYKALHKLRPFSGTQLFALIMAPAMASRPAMKTVDDGNLEGAWPSVLASLVSHLLMSTILAKAVEPPSAKNSESTRLNNKLQTSLF